MDWINTLGNITKIPLKFFVVATAVSGILVSLSPPLLKKLQLENFMSSYGSYVAIVFISCVAIVLVEVAIKSYQSILAKKYSNASRKTITDKIQSLDSTETSIIRELFFDGSSTTSMPIDNPAVAELLHKGVLITVGSMGHRSYVGTLFPVRLSRIATKELNPTLIGLGPYLIDNPKDQWMVSDAGINWVRNNRPTFMRRIEEDKALFEGRFH